MDINLKNPQQITHDTMLAKYAKGSETTADEIFKRVCAGVASVEPEEQTAWADKFYNNMIGGAIGAGRIMSAAGTDISATIINCFVQPVGDAIQGVDDDGLPGIYDALLQAAETMRRGGGVGYDFSRIRPYGSRVKGTASDASGPCSYMDVFDASCKTVVSAGARRGAQMGVLRIDHPDIMSFITAKRTPGRWTNFNVSVFVGNDFMDCKKAGGMWELVHKATPSDAQIKAGAHLRNDGLWVYDLVNAADLWDAIMRSNYEFAEPGVLFEGAMNADNNLRYIEKLEATNPCAEQCLPAYGCCCLGQIILPRFVLNPFQENASFDFEGFTKAVELHVRFLDNVLDLTMWPLEQQKQEAMNKRRIGLGFTGLGNCIAMLGLGYNAPEGLQFGEVLTKTMRDTAYLASVNLAKERGAFPALEVENYLEEGTFASRLPEEIKALIRAHGIRNSHLLSIAPTGTVSLAFADNTSSGIEPPFMLAYRRMVKRADGSLDEYQVLDHGLRVWLDEAFPNSVGTALASALSNGETEFLVNNETKLVADWLPKSMVTALAMTSDDHLNMLKAVGPYIDSSISKTVNVPADCEFDDFKAIYDTAYEAGLKGVSTYRPNPIRGEVLKAPTKAEKQPVLVEKIEEEVASPQASTLADVDPLTVVIANRPEGNFEAVTSKVRYVSSSGDQKIYVSVSFTNVAGVIDGQVVEIERPLEVFIQGSIDGVANEWVAAYARNLSLLARTGLLAKALHDARNVRSDRGRVRYGWYEKNDGTKAPRFHDSEVACIAYVIQEMLIARGLLDSVGNPVPARYLLKQIKRSKQANHDHAAAEMTTTLVASGGAARLKTTSTGGQSMPGTKCAECGAHAVIKRDGCEFCTNCGSVGSCG
jgi:ribonucleoside-diphosphate reductase alpha chain